MHNSMTAWRNEKENSSGRFLTRASVHNSMTARFRRRMSVDLPIVLEAGSSWKLEVGSSWKLDDSRRGN